MRVNCCIFKSLPVPRKLKAFFTKPSLIKKLMLAYIIILLLPVVIFGLFSFQNIRNNIQKDALHNSMLVLQQSKNNIDKNVETCEIAAQSIINNKDIIGFASSCYTRTMDEVVDFKFHKLTNIESVMHANPNIHVIRFFLKNIGYDEIPPMVLDESSLKIDRSWVKRILELGGSTFWGINVSNASDVQSLSSADGNSIFLFREVEYPVGEHVGILQVSMLLNVFFSDIFDSADDLNSFMCVTNGNNVVINLNNAFYKKLNIDKTWVVKNLIGMMGNNPDGNFNIGMSDTDVTVAYTYIKKIDSYLFRVSSISATAEKLDRTKYVILPGVMGIFLVLTLVTYIITSVLFKKLKIIISLMRKVEEGQMFIDIPELGKDEIGELSRHFQTMLAKINELIFTVVRKQAVTKDAEIKALHSQINAHFIYNVLESIKMIAFVKYQYEISDALTLLGRLMRYNIDWKNQYVPLYDEVNHIENYIRLINIRHDNKVTLNMDIDDRLRRYKILKMLLQPVVENAVNHGLGPKGTCGVIDVRTDIHENILNIIVTDDGTGMSAYELKSVRKKLGEGCDDNESGRPKSNGIGLENVNERIRLYYGIEFGLDIRSEKNSFTEVTVRLPYNGRKAKEGDA